MAGRKSDFTLTRLDDLFSTQEQRDEEKLSKIRDIPLELIDDFPDHPFKVRDDEDKTISFDTLTEKCDYEIIAAFKTVVYTDSPESFKYYQFINADTGDEFNAYITKC